MTDKQREELLRSAMADLRKTREGYVTHPNGPWWSLAMPKLERLRKDLAHPPVPLFGPVLEGGPSMSTYSPTHDTDDIPVSKGIYIAFDAGFGQAGRWVLAPERLTVQAQSGAVGGDAFYATGVSGIDYWIGHIGISPATGTVFAKGQRMARIADQAATDHVHFGLDTRPLTGKLLKYGANGNGPDYTWGADPIGVQLRQMLGAA